LNTSNSTLDSNSSLTNQDSARNSATSGVQGSGSDNTVKNANQNQFTAAFGQQLQAQMAQAQAVQQAAQVQAVQAAQAQAAQVAQAAQMAQAQVQAQAQAAQAQATLSQPNRGNISPETEFLFKAVPQLIEKVQLLYTELEQEKTKRGILESKVEWMTKRIDLLEAWKKQHEKVENGGAVTPKSSKANEALNLQVISPKPDQKDTLHNALKEDMLKAMKLFKETNYKGDTKIDVSGANTESENNNSKPQNEQNKSSESNSRLENLKKTLAELDKQKNEHRVKIEGIDAILK